MKAKDFKQIVKEAYQEILNEESNINFDGNQFKLGLNTNINPTKKGIKIQLTPLKPIELSDDEKNKLSVKFQTTLNKGLAKYNLVVDIDPDVPRKDIIGFWIRLGVIEQLIRQALTSGSSADTPDTES